MDFVFANVMSLLYQFFFFFGNFIPLTMNYERNMEEDGFTLVKRRRKRKVKSVCPRNTVYDETVSLETFSTILNKVKCEGKFSISPPLNAKQFSYCTFF